MISATSLDGSTIADRTAGGRALQVTGCFRMQISEPSEVAELPTCQLGTPSLSYS
jgi:hypothetical protein